MERRATILVAEAMLSELAMRKSRLHLCSDGALTLGHPCYGALLATALLALRGTQLSFEDLGGSRHELGARALRVVVGTPLLRLLSWND